MLKTVNMVLSKRCGQTNPVELPDRRSGAGPSPLFGKANREQPTGGWSSGETNPEQAVVNRF